MLMSGVDKRSGHHGARAVCLVVTLVLLALGLIFSGPGHTHAQASEGWYNAECPLDDLTARAELLSLLPVPSSVSTGLIASEAPPVAAQTVPAPVVLVAASRAPPLA
jgi:hypothetical protein